MAVIIFFCWYYPIGMYRNAIPAHQVHERGGLMFLFTLAFMLFTSTFTDMVRNISSILYRIRTLKSSTRVKISIRNAKVYLATHSFYPLSNADFDFN